MTTLNLNLQASLVVLGVTAFFVWILMDIGAAKNNSVLFVNWVKENSIRLRDLLKTLYNRFDNRVNKEEKKKSKK